MKAHILLAAIVAVTPGFRNMRSERDPGPIQDRADSTDWKTVDQAMGQAGKPQPDGAYKYSLPRSDLKVRAASVTLKPALALGSWVAFHQESGKTMAMGDLVLTEAEITPVLTKLE